MTQSTRISCALAQQEEFWSVLGITIKQLIVELGDSVEIRVTVSDDDEERRWKQLEGAVVNSETTKHTFGIVTWGHNEILLDTRAVSPRSDAIENLWGSSSGVTISWNDDQSSFPRLILEKSSSDGVAIADGTEHDIATAQRLLTTCATQAGVILSKNDF